MPGLSAADFPRYFSELHGYAPFPWQTRLADSVIRTGEWPNTMSLATASGKTACIDIAIFALAVAKANPVGERHTPLRIVFVVNRRVIVDEAYSRAVRIARALEDAAPGTQLHNVSEALRPYPGAKPLTTYLLRGGVYRDAAWCANPEQPSVICSTVDQVGSRVLFRGYGVSASRRPIEAALLGEDALWLLDEAHVARPFARTLREIARYRRAAWAKQPLPLPWHLVEMTATPSDTGAPPFQLDTNDLANPILKARREAPKEIRVIKSDAKKQAAEVLAREALTLFSKLQCTASDGKSASVAVIVNRVATARAVYALIKDVAGKNDCSIELILGRMRGFDREKLTRRLDAYGLKTGTAVAQTRPVIVIATQCIECGADLDFAGLISECAPIDALRQRFGRLNRAGSPGIANGSILLPIESSKPDFIYGDALKITAQWLKESARNGIVEFGIGALDSKLADLPLSKLATMQSPSSDAPVLMPPILNAWIQTNPSPVADPDIAPFLHGTQKSRPEINVLWRAGLTTENADDQLSAFPPVASECAVVPIAEVLGFLRNESPGADSGDCESTSGDDETNPAGKPEKKRTTNACRIAYVRREDVWIPFDANVRLHPGEILVIPVSTGGWSLLTHVPEAPADPVNNPSITETNELARMDIAESAALTSRDKITLRLGRNLPLSEIARAETAVLLNQLRPDETCERVSKKDRDDAVANWLKAAQSEMTRRPEWTRLAEALGKVRPAAAEIERLGDTDDAILYWEKRLGMTATPDEAPANQSRQKADRPVPLDAHQQAVSDEARKIADAIGLAELLTTTIECAGRHHDEGKRDLRFQGLLRGGDRESARFAPFPLAKSTRIPATREAREILRERVGLPSGFRHELLSVRLIEAACIKAPDTELLLHLVAAHHGYCRPLAPSVLDPENPTLSAPLANKTVEISSATGLERYDSGVLRRFVELNARYGAWGLAYLEAILRLADHRVSASESAR